MASLNLRDCVRGQVKFIEYRQGNLWYTTENAFMFPVPVDDCGEASFKAEDKGLLFMRYIRKHLEYLTQEDADVVER